MTQNKRLWKRQISRKAGGKASGLCPEVSGYGSEVAQVVDKSYWSPFVRKKCCTK
jgi:hypothetical protein